MATYRIRIVPLLRRKVATVGALWTPSLSRISPVASTATASCILCQWRAFSATARFRKDAEPAIPPKPRAASHAPSPTQPPPPAEELAAPAEALAQVQAQAQAQAQAAPRTVPSPLADAPRSHGKRTDEFTPTPLSRPIGMPVPPMSGENSGIDGRTLQQKRDDFVNYDKHLVRRKELKNKIVKPYFRDWSNLQFHKGKTFIAPPRLFRSDVSLYFPNLVGQRLLAADKAASSHDQADTTPLLEQSTATVVTLFSSLWAENQVRTFVSPEANPALAEVLTAANGTNNSSGPTSGKEAQLMQINVEENAMRAWLVRRFRGSLRKRINKRDWERYLLVTQGITDDIRENIGVLNSKVGYVYLVDQHCRIRWAGSGPSLPEERQSLVKGVQRLLAEAKSGRL